MTLPDKYFSINWGGPSNWLNAARQGRLDIVKLFTDNPYNVFKNLENFVKFTPFHQAAMEGQLEVCRVCSVKEIKLPN